MLDLQKTVSEDKPLFRRDLRNNTCRSSSKFHSTASSVQIFSKENACGCKGGMGSISDMRDKAFEEGQGEMLHGLLRVSFGKGKLRRSPLRYIRVASKDLNI